MSKTAEVAVILPGGPVTLYLVAKGTYGAAESRAASSSDENLRPVPVVDAVG